MIKVKGGHGLTKTEFAIAEIRCKLFSRAANKSSANSGRFEPGTNCRAWLFKILFHCVSHDQRKWLRSPPLPEPEVAQANLTQAAPISEFLTDDDILAALDRLPADFRAIVLIVDVEEFSYKDVSQILSIPLGTVMSRLSRGRKL